MLEGVYMFNVTNLTLSSDVDLDTYGKLIKTQGNTTHKKTKWSELYQQVTKRRQGTDKTA